MSVLRVDRHSEGRRGQVHELRGVAVQADRPVRRLDGQPLVDVRERRGVEDRHGAEVVQHSPAGQLQRAFTAAVLRRDRAVVGERGDHSHDSEIRRSQQPRRSRAGRRVAKPDRARVAHAVRELRHRRRRRATAGVDVHGLRSRDRRPEQGVRPVQDEAARAVAAERQRRAAGEQDRIPADAALSLVEGVSALHDEPAAPGCDNGATRAVMEGVAGTAGDRGRRAVGDRDVPVVVEQRRSIEVSLAGRRVEADRAVVRHDPGQNAVSEVAGRGDRAVVRQRRSGWNHDVRRPVARCELDRPRIAHGSVEREQRAGGTARRGLEAQRYTGSHCKRRGLCALARDRDRVRAGRQARVLGPIRHAVVPVLLLAPVTVGTVPGGVARAGRRLLAGRGRDRSTKKRRDCSRNCSCPEN